jgi:hypothetical protein
VSGAQTFAEQVAQQRDALRDRLAALDYLAEVNARAESLASSAKGRESGGMVLDPVDPTRAVVPVVWLQVLLQAERMAGYDVIATSAELRDLLAEWNAGYVGRTGDKFEPLHRDHGLLAERLAAFMATL